MTKPLVLALLTALLAFKAHATAQMGERLLYKGQTNRLATLPLEPFLKAQKLSLRQVAPPKKFMMSTACWRGYVGTWEIKDGFLWLVSVEHLDNTPIPLDKLFPGQKSPVKATWYSGTLHVTQGKVIRYVHAEFASQFERDVYVEIEEGKVVGEKAVENKRE